MKTRGFVVTLILVGFAFTPQLLKNSIAGPLARGGYTAKLISPTAGQVLSAGQQVRVEWKSLLPKVDYSYCETELYLSLDGGMTFPYRITPSLDPHATFFYWTVPNTPTNAAILDIRFGCEGYYPESYSAQTASPFVIAPAVGELY
jgi:hypothetical protein